MKMPSWRRCPAGFERTNSWPNTRCAKENPITQHSLSSCLGAFEELPVSAQELFLGKNAFPKAQAQNLSKLGALAKSIASSWPPCHAANSSLESGARGTVSMELMMAGLYGLPSHSTKFPQNKLLDSQRLCPAAVKHSS